MFFIDDPPGPHPLGVYAVPPQGGEARLVSSALTGEGLPPGDAPPQAPEAVDPAFRLPADADNIHHSPDGTSIAWTVGSGLPVNVDRRQRSLWVIASASGPPRRLGILTGGDLLGWSEDGVAVLATGRPSEGESPGVWRIPIDGSAPAMLADADRPRAARLSPTGRWLAYYLAFEPDPARNGLWVVPSTAGSAAQPVRIFGSYRWGSDERLYVIPYDPDGGSLSLAVFDPARGTVEALRQGDAFPGGIASNDWSVSPDVRWIVYRSAADASLWSLSLGMR